MIVYRYIYWIFKSSLNCLLAQIWVSSIRGTSGKLYEGRHTPDWLLASQISPSTASSSTHFFKAEVSMCGRDESAIPRRPGHGQAPTNTPPVHLSSSLDMDVHIGSQAAPTLGQEVTDPTWTHRHI